MAVKVDRVALDEQLNTLADVTYNCVKGDDYELLDELLTMLECLENELAAHGYVEVIVDD